MCHLSVILSYVHAVAYKVDKHIVLVSVFFDFMEPIANMLKRLSLGHVVDNEGRLTILIEQFSDGSELLLPSGVPDLQLDDGTVVHFHDKGTKLHSYRYLMISLKGTLCEHLHETALSDPGISDYNDLEEAIRLDLYCRILYYPLCSYGSQLLL